LEYISGVGGQSRKLRKCRRKRKRDPRVGEGNWFLPVKVVSKKGCVCRREFFLEIRTATGAPAWKGKQNGKGCRGAHWARHCNGKKREWEKSPGNGKQGRAGGKRPRNPKAKNEKNEAPTRGGLGYRAVSNVESAKLARGKRILVGEGRGGKSQTVGKKKTSQSRMLTENEKKVLQKEVQKYPQDHARAESRGGRLVQVGETLEKGEGRLSLKRTPTREIKRPTNRKKRFGEKGWLQKTGFKKRKKKFQMAEKKKKN